MDTRTLGRTGRTVSVIGLGTSQLGTEWGEVSEEDARAVLDAAAESGVTFFDTADVYGDGRSEVLIGRWWRDNPSLHVTIATKTGRRLAQEPDNYSLDNFRAWTDRSRENLGTTPSTSSRSTARRLPCTASTGSSTTSTPSSPRASWRATA